MPCFLAGVGGEIGDLHFFYLDKNRCVFSVIRFDVTVDLANLECFQGN